MTREAMEAAGVGFAALDRIGVTVGPGSFTGLRVGLAFAKGLGLALDRPCVGVGTLQALAAAVTLEGPVAALIDAGRGMFDLQILGAEQADVAPCRIELNTALQRISTLASRRSLVMTGPAASATLAMAGVQFVPLEAPPPAVVARIAASAPLVPPRPIYLRAPDAEPKARVIGLGASLRAVRRRDAAALAGVHAAAFEEAPGQEAWDAASLLALAAAPESVSFAAVVAGRLVAFVLARVLADEAEILTLAVCPAHRRRGIAAALVEAVAGRAARRGAATLFLEVADDAIAARALYARTGFYPVGRRSGYYGKGDSARDALVLRRPLPPSPTDALNR